MLIIDKGIKDYYDWYCSVLGIDKSTVYDRRECVTLGNGNYKEPLKDYFWTQPLYKDTAKKPIRRFFNADSIAFRTKIQKDKEEAKTLKACIKAGHINDAYSEGRILHFILEAGDTHYCFEIERYLDETDPANICHIDAHLIQVHEHVTQRYGGDCPLSIIPVYATTYHLITHGWTCHPNYLDLMVKNPILTNTFIPAFIPAEEMWRRIYDFLSSLKDKPIIDSRTNNEHIESAGFDKKESFRPKIKTK